jgi:hypothetical protein
MSKSRIIEEKQVRYTVELKPEGAITTLAHDFDEQDIAQLAYELWQSRGCPDGSPQEDWFRAVEQLQSAGK